MTQHAGGAPQDRSDGTERARLSADHFDLVVVGGGIHGAMVLLEAARRGLKGLLLERGEFGRGTTANSLGIVHGGLRYLQTLDLARFHESVRERRWLLGHFPDLVEPLPFLMPLYDEGLLRRPILRLAIWANDVLSARRNVGLRPDRQLPRGRMLGREELLARFPAADAEGLVAAAEWSDARVIDPADLVNETIRWACSAGCVALEHLEARRPLGRGNGVAGVVAWDHRERREVELRCDALVNAAGAAAPAFAAACGQPLPELFPPSLAWNLALERPPLADCAVAVRPRRPGAQVYFLLPREGRLVAGTGHAPAGTELGAKVPREHVRRMLGDLNQAVPGLALAESEVLEVSSGFLPVRRAGTTRLATRARWLRHDTRGGLRRLLSLSGVKLTTSRAVAARAITMLFPDAKIDPGFPLRRPSAPVARRLPAAVGA